MKTAVSIPDDVFARAEALAKRQKLSRSGLFGRALAEYLARHSPDQVTEAMDRLCADLDPEPDGFGAAAARRALERSEW